MTENGMTQYLEYLETFVILVRRFGTVDAARRLTEHLHVPQHVVDDLVREYERQVSTWVEYHRQAVDTARTLEA